MTAPTLNVQEAVEVFRKYNFPMTTEKLKVGLVTGKIPVGTVLEMNHDSFIISRLKLYEYLADYGVPVVELREYVKELRENGWITKQEALEVTV